MAYRTFQDLAFFCVLAKGHHILQIKLICCWGQLGPQYFFQQQDLFYAIGNPLSIEVLGEDENIMASLATELPGVYHLGMTC